MKKIWFLLCHDAKSTGDWLNRLSSHFHTIDDQCSEVHLFCKSQNTMLTTSNLNDANVDKLCLMFNPLTIRARLYGYADSHSPEMLQNYNVLITTETLKMNPFSSELMIAVYRLYVWHYANVYVVKDLEEEDPDSFMPYWFPYYLVCGEYKIPHTHWTGSVGLLDEKRLFLSVCRLRIFNNIHRRRTLLCDRALYTSPQMEVLHPITAEVIPPVFCSSMNQYRCDMPYGCKKSSIAFLIGQPLLCRIACGIERPTLVPDLEYLSNSYKTNHWLSLIEKQNDISEPLLQWRGTSDYIYLAFHWPNEKSPIVVTELSSMIEVFWQLQLLNSGLKIGPDPATPSHTTNISTAPGTSSEKAASGLPESGSRILDTPTNQESYQIAEFTSLEAVDNSIRNTAIMSCLSMRTIESSIFSKAKRKIAEKKSPIIGVDSRRRHSLNGKRPSVPVGVSSEQAKITMPGMTNNRGQKPVTYSTVEKTLAEDHYLSVIRNCVTRALTRDCKLRADEPRFAKCADKLFTIVLNLYQPLPTHLLCTEKIISAMADENAPIVCEQLDETTP